MAERDAEEQQARHGCLQGCPGAWGTVGFSRVPGRALRGRRDVLGP